MPIPAFAGTSLVCSRRRPGQAIHKVQQQLLFASKVMNRSRMDVFKRRSPVCLALAALEAQHVCEVVVVHSV